jgi:hypothetical protein
MAAEKESRKKLYRSDFLLKQQAFRKLKRRWMKCEVDLFAVA